MRYRHLRIGYVLRLPLDHITCTNILKGFQLHGRHGHPHCFRIYWVPNLYHLRSNVLSPVIPLLNLAAKTQQQRLHLPSRLLFLPRNRLPLP